MDRKIVMKEKIVDVAEGLLAKLGVLGPPSSRQRSASRAASSRSQG